MNSKEFEQIKSYSILIVAELHRVIFHEATYKRIKSVLRLAEELECQIMGQELKCQEGASNVVKLQRFA